MVRGKESIIWSIVHEATTGEADNLNKKWINVKANVRQIERDI